MSTEPLYEAVAARLRESIHAGALGDGERVPSVRVMSRQVGVSIGTVVQAYQQLEAQGVIVARPQSGYYVRRAQLPGIALKRSRATPKPRPPSRNLLDQVIALYARDDLVPLHVAIPSPTLLPTARVAEVSRDLLRRAPERLYGYVQSAGLPALRQAIARRLVLAGVDVEADDVVVTAGALEAITLSLQAICKPGDAVLVESPTYYGLLQAIAALGLKVVEIPVCCDDGLDLECALKALATQPIRAAVLIPSFSNPSGSLMPAAARRTLAQACARLGVPVIEDDVYGELAFDGSRPVPLMAFDEADNVILCGSASKIIGPGLRIGWAVSPRWREALLRAKAFTSIAASTLSQHVTAELLTGANLERPLRRLRGEIAANVGRFRGAIARHWPRGTCVSQPRGGLVLWVRLPAGFDGQTLFERASEVGIGIVPGNLFSASGAHRDCVRLSCAVLWEPRIEQALAQLGRLAHG
ncbi:MAG: PLP-dependent aminotransferase family protein [Rhodanobacteraceae bacterium]|nr:PLP-dependent aminotransferase family protein [Rhodanobacteraceae bacterium]